MASARPLPDFPYSPPIVKWRAGEPAPAFYAWRRVYPFLEPLLEWRDVILAEAMAIGGDGAAASLPDGGDTAASAPDGGTAAAAAAAPTPRFFDWPETSLYDGAGGATWRVLPFCHTFPANDASKTTWLPTSTAACPQTAALLRRIPGLRTALFSRMGPRTELAPHSGWADLSNHVLRVHMPLLLPGEGGGGGARACGITVGDAVQHHRMGNFIVFDDSKEHSAFNSHPHDTRYVLIFDLVRPPGLPPGKATGATSEELQGFIDYFR